MTFTQKSTPPVSVGRMINQLSRWLSDEMEVQLEALDLTPKGFFVLMTLLEQEGVTQSELGKRLKMPAYGISRLIDSLHGSGFVERREDPASRRNHLVFLLPQGRALAPSLRAVSQRVNTKLLASLPAEERQAFTETLAKLAHPPLR